MIWRATSLQLIRSLEGSDLTVEQREHAMLWLNEISATCDMHAPVAPEPIVEVSESGHEILIGWNFPQAKRSLVFSIDRKSAAATYVQTGPNAFVDLRQRPDYQHVVRFVKDFFEGWS